MGGFGRFNWSGLDFSRIFGGYGRSRAFRYPG
jgi:hypothetical protein